MSAEQPISASRLGPSPEAATRQAVQENGLVERTVDALEDVLIAHDALRAAGLLEPSLHAEYPLAGSLGPVSLMAG